MFSRTLCKLAGKQTTVTTSSSVLKTTACLSSSFSTSTNWFSPSEAQSDGLIYELRNYQLQTKDFGAYMQLCNGDAFKARLDASPLVFFGDVQIGGTLSTVTHIWSYESINQRAQVRADLAGNPTFLSFLKEMTPYLVDQTSVLMSGNVNKDVDASETGHWYMMLAPQADNSWAPQIEERVGNSSVQVIGSWKENLGDQPGQDYILLRADDIGNFWSSNNGSGSIASLPGVKKSLLAPAAFSPLK